jgi:hypothetical protein
MISDYAITDVPGIKVGHASDFKALTDCTVIFFEEGAGGWKCLWKGEKHGSQTHSKGSEGYPPFKKDDRLYRSRDFCGEWHS